MSDEPRWRPNPLPLVILSLLAMLAPAFGVLPAWPGLIHYVALPPLGLVHDLAALLVNGAGWASFMLGVAASLLGRSVLLAFMTGFSRESLLTALRFYLAALPLAALAAASFYGAGAVLFYALFWFGVLFSLLLAVLFGALPWLATDRLRGRFRLSAGRGFRAGTIGAYLVVLASVGVVADLTGPTGSVAMVPASAAATWVTARTLRAGERHKRTRRGLALVGAAGLGLLAVIVLSGPGAPPTAGPPGDSPDGSIMLMSGIDSRSGSGAILEIDPHAMGWDCDHTFYYSYAGPGNGQPQRVAKCPIEHGAPYERIDTVRATDELVAFLEAQTAEMTPPGVLATHSQGVWLSWQAAAENRLPNVERLVLIGPFPDNPISYPPAGREAPGAIGRLALEVVTVIPRPGGTSVFEPDSPLGREWLAHPTAIETTMNRALPPGIRAATVPSVFDLPLMPAGPEVEGAAAACPIPVIHPNLPYALEFHRVVIAFTRGEALPECPWWRTTIGPLFRHFTAPPGPHAEDTT